MLFRSGDPAREDRSPRASADTGYLSIQSPIPLRVVRNGDFVGTSEDSRLSLPAGHQVIGLENESVGFRDVRIVEVIPGTEGLLHISQIAESRIRTVNDILTEGDIVAVKVIEIDGNGKMRLSRKAALRDQPALAEKEQLKVVPSGAS